MRLSAFLHDHSVLLVFLFATTFVFFWLLPFRKRLRINTIIVLLLSFLSVLTGFLSLIMFAWLEGIGNPNASGGYSLFGSVFFMPITFWLGAKITKRDVSSVFDILTIPMIVALLCARMNCLLTGCCVGLPISGTNGLHWPTREMELVYDLVFIFYFAPKVLKGRTKGEVYPWYMLSYGVVRFVLETFRYSDAGTMFHLSHFWAIISFCIGLTFVIEMRETKKRRK